MKPNSISKKLWRPILICGQVFGWKKALISIKANQAYWPEMAVFDIMDKRLFL
jgi:hypothetical protein